MIKLKGIDLNQYTKVKQPDGGCTKARYDFEIVKFKLAINLLISRGEV